MEEDYNWSLILKVAVPFSIIAGYFNYINISNGLKFLSIIVCSVGSAGVLYLINKKKSNIFTAAAVVFLVALVIKFLKNSSLI